MKKPVYQFEIFPNGRVVPIERAVFAEAVDSDKELAVFCGGYSGGYARVLGAEKELNYKGNPVWNYYASDVLEEEWDPERLTKIYRLIATNGIKIYMKTGQPANQCCGGFADWDTKYEAYSTRFLNNEKMTKAEFEDARMKIDVQLTIRMLKGIEDEETVKKELSQFLSRYV